MNREYKFRYFNGKEWVYFNLFDIDNADPIYACRDTLGEYTGLKDRNGREIYEGDIVRYNLIYIDGIECIAEIKFCEYEDDEGYSTHIHLGWCIDDIGNHNKYSLVDIYGVVEVIGNIHENPELLNE